MKRDIGYHIIGAAMEVHSFLGPGMLESAYQECLIHELKNKGFKVAKEVILPIAYKGIIFEKGYRMDILVNDSVILEIKVVEALNDVHLAQMLTYLKFSKLQLGFLINFNVLSLKQGIRRVVL
jgi:GxxExxY protein